MSRKITQADRDKFELFLFEMDDVLEPFLSNAQQAGYRLDCTLDSLPVLEAYWLAASGVAEDLETMAQRAARYYGEVFRKSYGGQWRLSDENPKSMYYGFPVLYGFNPAAPGFEFCPLFVIRNFTIRKVPGSLLKAVEAAVPKQ